MFQIKLNLNFTKPSLNWKMVVEQVNIVQFCVKVYVLRHIVLISVMLYLVYLIITRYLYFSPDPWPAPHGPQWEWVMWLFCITQMTFSSVFNFIFLHFIIYQIKSIISNISFLVPYLLSLCLIISFNLIHSFCLTSFHCPLLSPWFLSPFSLIFVSPCNSAVFIAFMFSFQCPYSLSLFFSLSLFPPFQIFITSVFSFSFFLISLSF